MDKEKWVKYTQEIERIFKENRIISKIQRIKEENKMNFNDNHLQKIWDLIENSVKIAAKKPVPTKKIKHSSKPIIKNKGHTSSFKDLREVTEILALTKKLQENQSLSPDLQTKINGKIERIIKTYPLLTFENYSNLTDPSDIPWESWKTNLQQNIKAIKEVNYREETTIKEKEIKKAIQTRVQDFETNQKRMINSLTNQRKNTIVVDRILIKDQYNPYISVDSQEVLKETEKHYNRSF